MSVAKCLSSLSECLLTLLLKSVIEKFLFLKIINLLVFSFDVCLYKSIIYLLLALIFFLVIIDFLVFRIDVFLIMIDFVCSLN